MADDVLAVEGLEAGYGGKQILFGIGFALAGGEVVTLLGANGSGKSTVLKAVSGFVRPQRGSVRLFGREIAGLAPHAVFRAGVAQVSQARDLFPDMSVEENLSLGASVRRVPVGALLEQCYGLVPRLAERRRQRVGLMSGGEQQMVAMGRALMARPRLLLMDEPSMGLSPAFVDQVFDIIQTINRQGVSILVVEQNAAVALGIGHRGYVLQNGGVVMAGEAAALLAADEIKRAYLGEA